MPITLDEALQFTLKWEGGFTNHPKDPGGPTNFGIIQSRYDEYRNYKKLPKQSVKFITKTEYTEIYDKYYWDPVRSQWLQGTLGLVLFDTAVNMGVGGAMTRLHKALNLPIESVWTKAISDLIHESDQDKLALEICKMRIAKRYARVSERKDQAVFLRGWLNRDNSLIVKVKSLAGLTPLSLEEFSYDFDEDEIMSLYTDQVLYELEQFDEENSNEV
jgi:lysozyme family protein